MTYHCLSGQGVLQSLFRLHRIVLPEWPISSSIILTLPFRKAGSSARSRQRKVARQQFHQHRDGTGVSVQSKTGVDECVSCVYQWGTHIFCWSPLCPRNLLTALAFSLGTPVCPSTTLLAASRSGTWRADVGAKASRLQTTPDTCMSRAYSVSRPA